MIIGIFTENPEYIVEISKAGEYIRIIKQPKRNPKTLRQLLEEHRDLKDPEDNTKNRLTPSQKVRFNTIHKVNTRP